MTDYGKQENPITKAWRNHPEWRADFMKNEIFGSYKTLFDCLEKQAIDKIKVGGTDPD